MLKKKGIDEKERTLYKYNWIKHSGDRQDGGSEFRRNRQRVIFGDYLYNQVVPADHLL